jgi:pSer/pThr/pTyr-binding forkhead associated (FHA) protein
MASTSSVRIAYPQASLISVGQPTVVVIPLDRPVTLVGSGDIAHLRLHSRHVDAVHAVILNADGRIVVRDLASGSGVIVNGSRAGLAVVGDGDEITFGRTTFKLESGELVQAAVDQPSPEAELISDRWRLELTAPICLIGSGPGCDAPLCAEAVAPKHAIACTADGGWMLRGLVPNNFPRLNGRAKRRLRLSPAARVGIGAVELKFVSHRAAEPSTTASPVFPSLGIEVGYDTNELRDGATPPRIDIELGHDEPPPPRADVDLTREKITLPGEVDVVRDDLVQAPSAFDDARHDVTHTPGDMDVERDDFTPSALPESEPASLPPDETEPGVAAPPVEPTNAPSAAQQRNAAVAADDLEPMDEAESPDDSTESKVGINYEAIKAWGPVAAALVAGASGEEFEPPKESQPEPAGMRRWVLTGAAVAVLVIGALVGWYVLSG